MLENLADLSYEQNFVLVPPKRIAEKQISELFIRPIRVFCGVFLERHKKA
jgi:hypothetical protein